MNPLKIKLTVDSRDLHAYQKFGQIDFFPRSQNYDDPNIPEKIQPPGNVECTCYTATYIGQNKTKKEYDIDELFSRVPTSSSGANPRDVLGEVIKNGFLIKGTTTYDKPFSSYWRADTGQYTPFYNSISAMILTESPIAIWTNWFEEWLNLAPNSIMPIGQNVVSGHMYACKGWGWLTTRVINGERMFIIEFWGGYTLSMPEETFNDAVSRWGCGTAVLSTSDVDEKRKISLLRKLLDACQNLLLLLRQQYFLIVKQ